MSIKVIESTQSIQTVSVIADSSETGCRYHVVLSYDKEREKFILAVTNYFISIESPTLEHCVYKLGERGMVHSEMMAVGRIVSDVLAPKLISK